MPVIPPDATEDTCNRARPLGNSLDLRTHAFTPAPQATVTPKLGSVLAVGLGMVLVAIRFASAEPPHPRPAPGAVERATDSRTGTPEPPLPPGALARLGSSRLRHGGVVTDIAFSPDRIRMVSCGLDNTVRIWDARTGEQLAFTRMQQGWNCQVRFTSDGKSVVAVYAEAQQSPVICRIDVATAEVVTRLTLATTPAHRLYLLSPDGTRMAMCDRESKEVYVLDTITGQEIWREEISDLPGAFAYAADGRTLAAIADNRIHLFETASNACGQRVIVEPTGSRLSQIALSPDGSRVAAWWTVDSTRKAKCAVWDCATGRLVWSRDIGDLGYFSPHTFSLDGKWLAGGHHKSTVERKVAVMSATDGADGVSIGVSIKGVGNVPCVCCRADGMLAIGGEDGTIQLFNLMTGRAIDPRPNPPRDVRFLRFSADGKTIFGAADGWYAWDIATHRQQQLTTEAVSQERISFDGMQIVRANFSGNLPHCEIVTTATGKRLHLDGIAGSQLIWGSPDFTQDGKVVLAQCDRNVIQSWATDTGRRLFWMATSAERSLGQFGVSADGRVLVASSVHQKGSNWQLEAWDLATGKPLAKFAPADLLNDVSVSADGRRVAAGVIDASSPQSITGYQQQKVSVWDVASGRVVTQVPQHQRVESASLSPDGRLVAFSVWDLRPQPALQVYEVATGSERFSFRHEGMIRRIVFSPDGKMLAAASRDAPVYLWDLTGNTSGPAPAWDAATADQVWDDLAARDGVKGFAAIRRLRASPAPSLPFLKARAKLVAPDEPQLKALLANLAGDDFQIREKATASLAGYDLAIRPVLEAELRATRSPEARRRLEGLVNRLDSPTPIQWRLIRAVEAVEGMGTPEADALLAEWASGKGGPTLATEATAVIARRRK